MDVLSLQFLLAIILFFLVNWLGGESAGSGYQQISLFTKAEYAPAQNTLYRVLSPIVFLLVTASILYAVGLDRFVTAYWRVTLFYFVLRWLFNIALERAQLIRWSQQVLIGSASIMGSWLANEHLIRQKRHLLPDPANLANELWLVIILFLYSTWNRLEYAVGAPAAEQQSRYLQDKFRRLNKRFGSIVRTHASSRDVEALAFAVMIYEGFNRPRLYQWIERYVLFPLGRCRTLGPMQVRTIEAVDDTESVAIGVRKLSRAFAESARVVIRERQERGVEGPIDKDANMEWGAKETARAVRALEGYDLYRVRQLTLQAYNIRSDYPSEVEGIYSKLSSSFFPDVEATSGY